jgi:hypothetical protein
MVTDLKATNHQRLMKYTRILLFVMLCQAVQASAIRRDSVEYPEYHSVGRDTDTVIRKRSISVGMNYGSDALFFGRTGPITYPYVSTDVIYNARNGLFAYGSALKLLGYPTLVDEIDLGGGYYYRLSKKFNGAISYTRFIFNKNERVIESASSNDINFKNSYDWKIAKSSVVLDYLFGKSSDFFVTVNTSKYIESSWNVFDDKDYLSINPGISVIFGTQNFVQRYSLDHEDRLMADAIAIFGPNHVEYDNGRFNALNYSFKIPLAYNRPHYTIEASYKYSIPVNVEGALMNKRESFYNLTFYYVFY